MESSATKSQDEDGGAGRRRRSASILLVCGLPASGKSTLVSSILRRLRDDAEQPRPRYHRIVSINYDDVTNGEIERSRNERDDDDDAAGIAAWRTSRRTALNLLDRALADHFDGDDGGDDDEELLVVLDDNFHLRSMRREVYRTCQRRSGRPDNDVFFSTVAVEAPVDACLRRNRTRVGRARVPDDVVARMGRSYEPPADATTTTDARLPWERPPRRVSVRNHDDDDVDEVLGCLAASRSFPLRPVTTPADEAAAAADRARTRDDRLHAADRLLRRLVGVVCRADRSSAARANRARRTVLDLARRNDDDERGPVESLVFDEFLRSTTRGNDDDDDDATTFALSKELRIAYDEFLDNGR